jgi:hypothetical protein
MTVLDLMTMLAQCPLSAEVYTCSPGVRGRFTGDLLVVYDEPTDQARGIRPIKWVKYMPRCGSIRDITP